MAYSTAVEIWNEATDKYTEVFDTDPQKYSEDSMADFLEKIKNLSFDEAKTLAKKYISNEKVYDMVSKEMEESTGYRDFLNEIIFQAGMGFGI